MHQTDNSEDDFTRSPAAGRTQEIETARSALNTHSGNNDEAKSHDEILDLVGGLGWLQAIAALGIIPAVLSGDMIVNIFAFHTKIPHYEC